MPGRPTKEFQQYLVSSSKAHVSHADYLRSPASAFLNYTVEAKNAINLCARYFPKNADGNYSKDSNDSLQHLVLATLPALMGHFETYQRHLFGGMFDLSVFLTGFDVEDFFKRLEKHTEVKMDWVRLSAHRRTGANSVGMLLSDNLSGWHNPDRVNKYFGAFGLPFTPFGHDESEKLKTLWQLRHSIAHTGGTLTMADAQKVTSLHGLGGRNIAFERSFTFEVSRKLHPLVKRTTEGLGTAFSARLIGTVDTIDRTRIDEFFAVKSSVAVWLK